MKLSSRSFRAVFNNLSLKTNLYLELRNELLFEYGEQAGKLKMTNISSLFYYFPDIKDILQNMFYALQDLSVYCPEEAIPELNEFKISNLSELVAFNYEGSCKCLILLLKYSLCCKNNCENTTLLSIAFRPYSQSLIMDINELLYFELNRENLRRMTLEIFLNKFIINAFRYYENLEELEFMIIDDANQFTDFPEIQNLKKFSLTKQTIWAYELAEILRSFQNCNVLKISTYLIEYVDLNFSQLKTEIEVDNDPLSQQMTYYKQNILTIMEQKGHLSEVSIFSISDIPVDILFILFSNEPHLTSIDLECNLTSSYYTQINYEYILQGTENYLNVITPSMDKQDSAHIDFSQFDIQEYDEEYKELPFEGKEVDYPLRKLTKNPSFFIEHLQDYENMFTDNELDIQAHHFSNEVLDVLSDLEDLSEESASSSVDEDSECPNNKVLIYQNLDKWRIEDNIEVDITEYIQQSGKFNFISNKNGDYEIAHQRKRSKSAHNLGFEPEETPEFFSFNSDINTESSEVTISRLYPVNIVKYKELIDLNSDNANNLCFGQYDFSIEQIHHAMLLGNEEVNEYFQNIENENVSENNELLNEYSVEYNEVVLLFSLILPKAIQILKAPQIAFSAISFSTLANKNTELEEVIINSVPIVGNKKLTFPLVKKLVLHDQSIIVADELFTEFPNLEVLAVNNLLSKQLITLNDTKLKSLTVKESSNLSSHIIEELCFQLKDSLAELLLEEVIMPTLAFQCHGLIYASFKQMIRQYKNNAINTFATAQAISFLSNNEQIQVFWFSLGNKVEFSEHEQPIQVCIGPRFSLLSITAPEAVINFVREHTKLKEQTNFVPI